MSQWVVWLIIVILLALIEAMSINLTTVWFVASGICALGVSLLYRQLHNSIRCICYRWRYTPDNHKTHISKTFQQKPSQNQCR